MLLAVRISSYGCTWEVWRALKKLELLSAIASIAIGYRLDRLVNLLIRHVIKELVHAFSCAYIELWLHLGSLESTQEARVALGYRLEQLLCFFRALQTSRVYP